MWIVIKYKRNEFNFLKQDFKKTLGDLPLFFRPKIKYKKIIRSKFKFIERDILGDYLICYHEKFKNNKILSILNNLKGLKYLLKDSQVNQKEIMGFINYCKSFENKEGYLTSAFFKTMITKKAEFISGPFSNMIIEIIERQKNKLKILVGNIVTTISDNKNYLYRPI